MTPRGERFTTASLSGVRLHALEWGDSARPLVVLLHGGGANAHWWDHVAPVLAERFRVVALDFRGHGDADYPEEVRVGAFAEDLAALVDHLSAARVALVGHSMGGGIALAHAARFENVSALVLVDVSRGASRRSRRAARLALALRRTYASREEAIARYRFLPSSDHASEELRLHIASHSIRSEADGRFGFKFDSAWFSLPSSPPPDLSRIGWPTMIVRGGDSSMLTAEGAEALREEIADARVVSIPRAGHHVFLDQPAAFLSAVQPFLEASIPY